jgi:hypothetical protein
MARELARDVGIEQVIPSLVRRFGEAFGMALEYGSREGVLEASLPAKVRLPQSQGFSVPGYKNP